VKRYKAGLATERKRLTVPADPAEVSKLAENYRNPAVGSIQVERNGKNTTFNFGAWHSEVASRKNDDGSISFMTISPGQGGLEFVVSGSPDSRKLILRDGQHEYVYDEVK
jgi:hypothetical protein